MREDKRIKELQRLALNTKRILRETNFLWFKLFIQCTRYCLIAHFCISFIHIFLLANNIINKGKCASVSPMKQGFVYKLLLRGMIETWEIQRIWNAVAHFCKNHFEFYCTMSDNMQYNHKHIWDIPIGHFDFSVSSLHGLSYLFISTASNISLYFIYIKRPFFV